MRQRSDGDPGAASRPEGGAPRPAAFQCTLKSPIHCSGVALHRGARVSMALHPAEPETGIVFVRTDLGARGSPVPATWRHAVEAPLCTTLAHADGTRVATVEHLLAALAGCGIDNAVIEVDGPELPIMDGSAAPFVFLIECAGVVEQAARRRALRVLKAVEVREGERSAALVPDDGLAIDFEIDYASPAVARQAWSVRLDNGTFKREVCRARTYGFLQDVERMRACGLARGGSLDNAVVVAGDRVLNEGGLRYDNEFVRHKVLDTIGDLYLVGAPLIGRFRGVCAGHALNRRLLAALFADEAAWCWEPAAAEAAGAAAGLPGRAVAARP